MWSLSSSIFDHEDSWGLARISLPDLPQNPMQQTRKLHDCHKTHDQENVLFGHHWRGNVSNSNGGDGGECGHLNNSRDIQGNQFTSTSSACDVALT